MTAILWLNLALAIPFLIAFIGVPLWITFRTPQTDPDHAQARGGTAAGDRARDAARHIAAA
jgi:hypothetical protein